MHVVRQPAFGRLSILLLSFAWLGAGSPAPAEDPGLPDLAQFTTSLGQKLDAVGSDADAAALFLSQIGPALNLSDAVSVIHKRRPPQSQAEADTTADSEVTASAVGLVAALSAWSWADRLAGVTLQMKDGALPTWIDRSARARQWLLQGDARPWLRRMSNMAVLLSSLHGRSIGASDPAAPSSCADFAASVDRTYPELAGPDSSWLSVAEREGGEGLDRRLAEFNRPDGQSRERSDACARQYIETRVKPILIAQLVSSSWQARADAYGQAVTERQRLSRLADRRRERRGLTRLCGTWQWTIHNHQNHQELKTAMVFEPPDSPPAPGPRPTKTVVLGDAVYLRWDFQGGFQEESLLFSNEGQRLEGTFVNSGGSWGSISGKRIGQCERK